MNKKRMTAKRLKVLKKAFTFAQRHGYSPSVDELCKMTGFQQSAVRYHLNALAREGFIQWRGYRKLTFLQPTFTLLKGGTMIATVFTDGSAAIPGVTTQNAPEIWDDVTPVTLADLDCKDYDDNVLAAIEETGDGYVIYLNCAYVNNSDYADALRQGVITLLQLVARLFMRQPLPPVPVE